MSVHDAKAIFDSKLLQALPSTTEALTAHILGLAKLDPIDIQEMLSSDIGIRRMGAGLRLEGIARRRERFSDLVEAQPIAMTDEEYANVLTGGTPSAPAHLQMERSDGVSDASPRHLATVAAASRVFELKAAQLKDEQLHDIRPSNLEPDVD